MAYRRRRRNAARRTYRRRSYRRGRSFRRLRKRHNLPRRMPFAGLPNSRFVKLRYCEEVLLPAAGPSVSSIYTMRANSLYDPNYTGTGHQPRGFDQLMASYNHFKVIKSRINVAFSSSDATGSDPPFYYGICLTDSGNIFGSKTPDYIKESRQCKVFKAHGSSGGYNGKPWSGCSTWFSHRSFFGGTYAGGNDKFIGDIANNPQEVAYFEIFQVPQVADSLGSKLALVTIDYWALLTEPKNIAQS